jgi:hypothetical protein
LMLVDQGGVGAALTKCRKNVPEEDVILRRYFRERTDC